MTDTSTQLQNLLVNPCRLSLILEKRRKASRDEVDMLKKRWENLQLLQVDANNGMLACDEECREWSARSKHAAERRELILRTKESLEPQLEQLQIEVASKLRLVEKRSESMGQEVNHTEGAHRRITELLGMRVIPKKSPSFDACCVQVEFTNIDARNPDRKFLILLKTYVDKTVTVTDSEPKIPHGLKRAVQKLNESHPRDFHSFWIWIRNEFTRLSLL